MIEVRHLETVDAGQSDQGLLLGVYRHLSELAKIGAGYNFGRFSDDLTDLSLDDKGMFINIIGTF